MTDHPTSDPRPGPTTTDVDPEPTTPVPPESSGDSAATEPYAAGTTRTPVWRSRRVQLGGAAAALLLVGGVTGWAIGAVTSDERHDHGAGFSDGHGRGFGDEPGGHEGFGPAGPGDHGPTGHETR